MAVSITNFGTGNTAGGTTHSCSFGFTATSGRTLFVMFAHGGGTQTWSNLTAGWNSIHDNTGSTRTFGAAAAYKLSTGGETSVSIDTSASIGTGVAFYILEIDGLDTSSPLDQVAENEANNNSSSASCATGTTATLSAADNWAIEAWAADGTTWATGTRTYTNSSTEHGRYDGTSCPIVIAYKQLASTTGFSETVSGTGADQCYGVVAVFKQATSGVSGTSATTNANDTSSASGTTTIVGTSASTNANDTSSASGVAGSITGTSTTTNANDTSSASGTTTIVGTSATTNANDTATASGTTSSVTVTIKAGSWIRYRKI